MGAGVGSGVGADGRNVGKEVGKKVGPGEKKVLLKEVGEIIRFWHVQGGGE